MLGPYCQDHRLNFISDICNYLSIKRLLELMETTEGHRNPRKGLFRWNSASQYFRAVHRNVHVAISNGCQPKERAVLFTLIGLFGKAISNR